jgi:hypothetical protein
MMVRAVIDRRCMIELLPKISQRKNLRGVIFSDEVEE